LQFFLCQCPFVALSASLGQACRTSCNVKHLDIIIWSTFSFLIKAIHHFLWIHIRMMNIQNIMYIRDWKPQCHYCDWVW
jgi:hypothetical protein